MSSIRLQQQTEENTVLLNFVVLDYNKPKDIHVFLNHETSEEEEEVYLITSIVFYKLFLWRFPVQVNSVISHYYSDGHVAL